MKRKPLFRAVGLILFISFASSCHTSKATQTKVNKQQTNQAAFIEEYSKKLGIELDSTCNQVLITTIADWLGTPYRYGSNTKKGTDCSGFTQMLIKEVYGITLARSSPDIYKQIEPIKEKHLAEGDLVFFRIGKNKYISHVGVYIKDRKFVHASTQKGVIISSLDEPYYKKYYYGAGRLLKK